MTQEYTTQEVPCSGFLVDIPAALFNKLQDISEDKNEPVEEMIARVLTEYVHGIDATLIRDIDDRLAKLEQQFCTFERTARTEPVCTI